MRIGEMELDEILHNCAKLNTLIKGSVQEAAVAWGLAIQWYEITEVSPDEQIHTAMDKQAAAECMRCEQVLQAEGNKRRAQLTSEGVKILLTNESEGNLIRVRNEAEAAKSKLLLDAEGEAEGSVSLQHYNASNDCIHIKEEHNNTRKIKLANNQII